MQQSVTDIISQEALKQLADATAHLDDCVKKMNELIAASQKLNFGNGNVADLQKVAEQEAKIQGLLQQLADAQNKVTEAAEKRQKAEEKAAKRRQELLDAELARQDKENQRAAKIIADREAAEIKSMERTDKEREKMDKRHQKMQERMDKEFKRYMQELEKASEKRQKAAEKEAKQAALLANEYEQLKKKYNDTAKEAMRLAAAYGTTSDEAKDMIKSASDMAEQLKEIEAAVGRHQRKVGDYQQATLALSQIIREAPAFANSLQTGLMAIGNNLAPLVDEFKQLKEATGDTKEALKILGGSLFSFTNIMILAFTAFQFIIPMLTKTDESAAAAAAAMDKYNDSLRQVNQTMAENIAQSQIENKQLMLTAANTSLSMKTRMDAIDKLRDANKGLLDDLTDETFLLDKTSEAWERLTKATYQKYVAEAFAQKAALAMKKQFELTTETIDEKGNIKASPIAQAAMDIKKAEQELAEYAQKQGGKFIGSLAEKDVERLQKNIDVAKAKYKVLNQELERSAIATEKFNRAQQDALLALQGLMPKDSNNLQALKEELSLRKDNLEKMRLAKGITADTKAAEVDAIIAADKEYGKSQAAQVARIKQLEELIDKLEGKEKKAPRGKDATLKSQSDLIKAVYESKVKEQEIIRDRNKAIADDEKADLQDRLKAYNEYFAAVLKLAQLERDMQVELENEKMDDLERQMSKATGKQLENLQDQYKAAQVRINTTQTEYNRKREVAETATHNDILGIVNSSNEEWIKSEDYRNQQLKENEIQRYMVEQNLLKHALENKEITRREYNKKLAYLQRREQLTMLQNQIEFDEKILANQTLSAEKRLEYEKKLNADREAYFKAQKGEQTGRKMGRITDSVAMLFAPEDLENQEQYLQEFYNRTVDLARQATQAILAARSQQFDVEKKRLDEQATAIRANYELEIAAINATERNEVERQNRINQALVQTQQKEAEIANQKKKIEIEQAKFQRAASIASIIQSTAVAIASALKYGPAAPPIIALIASAGAVQLASVANAPIPQYKHGIGIGNGEHKGGHFIAGDGGEPELIMPVGKKPYWSNSSSTLYNEGAGVKVIPMSVIKDAERQLTANSVDYGSISTTIIKFDENAIIDGLSKRFERSLVAHGNNLAMHIAGSRVDLSAIGEELRKQNALQ